MMLKPTLKRYLAIGISVYIFEVITIVVADWLGAKPILAISLSFWLGLIVSFGLQKIITFGDKRMHRRVVLPQLLAFSGLVLFNFSFTLLMTKLFIHLLPTFLIRTLALGITTIWNFYLYKTHIFKGSDNLVY